MSGFLTTMEKIGERASALVTTYDLNGALLTTPATMYSEWNTRRVRQAFADHNTLMAILQIIEAIFAYTILALPTAVGCVIKACDYPRLVKDNEHTKVELPAIEAGLKYAAAYSASSEKSIHQRGREMRTEYSVVLTEANYAQEKVNVEATIDRMTEHFQEVLWKSSGEARRVPVPANQTPIQSPPQTLTRSEGGITVELRRLVP